MKEHESHLSDRELIMAMDGELRPNDANRVESHLEACWTCRSRKADLEQAIVDFVHLHQTSLDSGLPSSDGPRAMLKARLAEMAESRPSPWWQPMKLGRSGWLAAATCGLLLALLAGNRFLAEPHPSVVLAAPNPVLTPGAAVLENPSEL